MIRKFRVKVEDETFQIEVEEIGVSRESIPGDDGAD